MGSKRLASSFERPASQAPQDEEIGSLRRGGSLLNLAGEVRDCLHHGVTHAGIVKRMTRVFGYTYFRLRPDAVKGVRCRRWTQQIIAALHDDAGNAGQPASFRHQLVRLHEAIVLEIMR